MATAELTKPATRFDIAALKFEVSQEQIEELRREYMPLAILDVNNKAEVARVHDARMVCVKLRRGIEKYAKQARDEANKFAKDVIAAERSLTDPISTIEAHLENEEGKVKREQERIAREAEETRQKMIRARLEMLSQLSFPGAQQYIVADVDLRNPADWESLLANARENRAAYDKREAERKAEAERIAEQQRVEAERLARERSELERQRQEQAAAQAKIDAENKRLADEEAARVRRQEIAKAQAEAAEKARQEAIAEQQQKEADAKAKADAEERERQRIESLRPDHEKLMAVASAIEAIVVPEVSPGAAEVRQQIVDAIRYAARDVRGFAGELSK